MARARNIKPSFFQNEELAELSPITRLAFIGMWTIADFKGCIEFRPKRLKVQLMPYDDCDFEEIAINLERSGLIRIYSVSGQRFIKIVNFEKHQNPHKNEREAGSDIPDYQPEAAETKAPQEIQINPDKDGTAPADSLFLKPSLLNPDSGSLDNAAKAAPASPKYDPKADLLESGVESQTAADWLALRKAKKAPVTKTALDAIKREVEKAGMQLGSALVLCCERGWAGFKAEWVQQARASPGYQDRNDKTKAFADALTGRRNDNTDSRIIDITPGAAAAVD